MIEKKGKCVAFIFARGGSKGVPRKNIRTLAGKPLIAYSIEAALASQYVDHVMVSTEDAEIADIARSYGAEVPFMRPEELARDTTPELPCWKHALSELEKLEGFQDIKYFLSLPATSPLRDASDIDRAVEAILKQEAEIVIGIRESERNPYFNMVCQDEEGWLRIACPPPYQIERRQDAPPVYDITTVVYATTAEYVRNTPRALAGKMKGIIIPPERAVDIDTEMDFAFAEFLLERKRG